MGLMKILACGCSSELHAVVRRHQNTGTQKIDEKMKLQIKSLDEGAATLVYGCHAMRVRGVREAPQGQCKVHEKDDSYNTGV